jgi:SAM-dependent methyltransferase
MARVAESLRSIREGSAVRAVLPEILHLAEREGILDRMQRISPFTFEELCLVLRKDLGYAIPAGNRRRMIRVLLDLLSECGWVRQERETWQWTGRGGAPGLSREEGGPDPTGRAEDDGQYLFFRKCLETVPSYLRGGAPSVVFDRGNAGTWEQFLACPEFHTCRTLLLHLLEMVDGPSFRLLDLCHGPGLGTETVATLFPSIRIAALDFTDAFSLQAKDRIKTVDARNRELGHPSVDVAWYGPGEWKGFGHPLPFGDSAFDAVFFSCGDPYIPRGGRAEVYKEIGRVLAPGGKLGILTRGYPDAGGRHVPSFWMRMAALAHDFAESVCEGWEGFSDVEESLLLFERLGFQPGRSLFDRMNFLESSLWVLKKGESRA